jgi:hypothetical protein
VRLHDGQMDGVPRRQRGLGGHDLLGTLDRAELDR